MKNSIMVFAPYFTPSVNAGGPVKSISNILANLSEQFSFLIFTRDRDMGEGCHFDANLKRNKWQIEQNARIYYVDGSAPSYYLISKEVRLAAPEVIYLNSFFDYFYSIKLVILAALGLVGGCRILIAPRGELSIGALGLKKNKKRLYVLLSRWFRLYKKKNIYFHATDEIEVLDIQKNLDVSRNKIFISPNIPVMPKDYSARESEPNLLKVIFLSRITPKKNLHFALNVLSKVSCEIHFDIYGPKEDKSYWYSCKEIINLMPSNVKVRYCGKVALEDVHNIFSKYDLFFFPTLGENYGHVIVESLLVGTQVLISDRTPWNEVKNMNLGYALPLVEERFIEALMFFSQQRSSNEDRKSRIKVANSLVEQELSVEKTRKMFINLVESKYV